MTRSLVRGLSLVLPLLLVHVACSSDDKPATSGIDTPGADSGPLDPGADGSPGTDGSTPGKDGDVPIDTGPPPPPPVVNDTNETLVVDGETRTYLLSVPIDYDSSKVYPLVLSYHGDGGSSLQQRTAYPFDKASQKEAIIAYPMGINNAWELYVPTATNKDLKFTQALVTELAGKYNIDTSKVLGFGYSNGAFFVNQIACKLPGLLRAISTHEGGAPADDGNGTSRTCTGATVAAFVFHGDADAVVVPASGSFDAKYWAKQNGCASFDPDSQFVDTDPTPPCKKSPDCPSATPVTYCLVPGLGHDVWSNGMAVTWQYWKALP